MSMLRLSEIARLLDGWNGPRSKAPTHEAAVLWRKRHKPSGGWRTMSCQGLLGMVALISALWILIGLEAGVAGQERQFIPFNSSPRLEDITERTDVGFVEGSIGNASAEVIMQNAVDNSLIGGDRVFPCPTIECSKRTNSVNARNNSKRSFNGDKAVASRVFFNRQTAPILEGRSLCNPMLNSIYSIYSRLLPEVHEHNIESYDLSFFQLSGKDGGDRRYPRALRELQSMFGFGDTPNANTHQEDCCKRSPKISAAKIFGYTLTLGYFVLGFALILYSAVCHSLLPLLVRWPASIACFAFGCAVLLGAFERIVPIF